MSTVLLLVAGGFCLDATYILYTHILRPKQVMRPILPMEPTGGTVSDVTKDADYSS